MTKPYLLRRDLTLVERSTGLIIGRLQLRTGPTPHVSGWGYVVTWGLHPPVGQGYSRRYTAAAAAWQAFTLYRASVDRPTTSNEAWAQLRETK